MRILIRYSITLRNYCWCYEYNDGIVVMLLKSEDLFFRSVYRDIYSYNDRASSRTRSIGYQFQGRTPNTSAHCIMVSESPRKILGGRILYVHRKETVISASIVSAGPPWPLLSANEGQGWGKSGDVPEVPWCTCLSRTKKQSWSPKQGKIFPHRAISDKPSIGCVGFWAPYLLV